jgi:dienelactone hydrolase
MRVEIAEFVYAHGGRDFAGYLAWDAALAGQRPGIAICHEWFGPGDNVKRRARMLAELGYVAFVLDVYGVDVRPKNGEEAAAAMHALLHDRAELRARLHTGIAVLKQAAHVNPQQIAVIGYCFGGGCALELARSGANVAGVVSFHGQLATTMPATVKPQASILALHGAEDPLVDDAKVAVFIEEMRAVQADWQLIHYGGAVHAFTNPHAHDLAGGLCFDAKADARSWQHMRDFLGELFA